MKVRLRKAWQHLLQPLQGRPLLPCPGHQQGSLAAREAVTWPDESAQLSGPPQKPLQMPLVQSPPVPRPVWTPLPQPPRSEISKATRESSPHFVKRKLCWCVEPWWGWRPTGAAMRGSLMIVTRRLCWHSQRRALCGTRPMTVPCPDHTPCPAQRNSSLLKGCNMLLNSLQ